MSGGRRAIMVVERRMLLEDYFEFINADEIRIKGHRLGIDDVLRLYLDGYAAEEIAVELPGLSLEKIYATITYYHHNRRAVDALLARLDRQREGRYQEWRRQAPSPVVERLRALHSETEPAAAVAE